MSDEEKEKKEPELTEEDLAEEIEDKELDTDEEDTEQEEQTTEETQEEEGEKTELEECQEKADEYLSGWKRARADYENLQKETDERVSRSIKFATEGLLQELLPTVDHFNYAFKAVPEEERESSWLKGVEHIQTNFLRVLQDHGIEMIETVGKKFDPELHEAVEEVEGERKQKSGTIAEEVSAGFTLHGKVIKCAVVKVVK